MSDRRVAQNIDISGQHVRNGGKCRVKGKGLETSIIKLGTFCICSAQNMLCTALESPIVFLYPQNQGDKSRDASTGANLGGRRRSR